MLLAVRPVGDEIRSDDKSEERHMARVLAEAMADGDTLVVTGTFRDVFEHYFAHWRRKVTIVAYPSQLEAHPSWIDWSAHDEPTLRREASDLVGRLRSEAQASTGRRLYVLLQPHPGNAPLARAMDTDFTLTRRGSLGPWSHELRLYVARSAPGP
jgi:hypothetical protein